MHTTHRDGSPRGGALPVAAAAQSPDETFDTISQELRADARRRAGHALDESAGDLRRIIGEVGLPPRYTFQMRGQTQNLDETAPARPNPFDGRQRYVWATPDASSARRRHLEVLVMRIPASLMVVSSLALPAAPVGAQTRNVDLIAADGVVLKASYFSAGKPGPGILLFHQCSPDGNRRLWEGLAADLVAAGFHVMTFDNRGFGETGGRIPLPAPPRPAGRELTGPVWSELSGGSQFPPGDGDAALAYLVTQQDVDSTRLAVAGSSCGATDAVDLAARRRNIKAVVLLSGLPSLNGTAHLAATPSLPVLGIYAEQDLGADGMRITIGLSKHPQSTLKMFPGSGHGVELFQQHPDLQRATVKWLQDQVSKP